MPRLYSRLSNLLAGPLARATLSTSAVLFIRLSVQAGFLLAVARLLGATLFGVFSGIAALAILLGSMATAGTHLVLLSEVSIDPARRNPVLRYALPTSLYASMILLCLYALLVLPLLRMADLPFDIALGIGLAEILFQPLTMLVAMEKNAHDKAAYSQLLLTLPLFFKLCAICLVYVLAPENVLRVFVWSYFVASACAFLIVQRHLPENWPSWRTWRRPNLSELKHSLGYATLNFTASAPLEADKVLALRLLPAHVVGVYAIGTRIIGALVLPIIAMLLSALPRLYRQHAKKSSEQKKLHLWILLCTLAYGVAIAIVLALSAPFFAFLFGTSYAEVSNVLRLLAFVVPALCLQISAANILMGQNKPWTRAMLELSGLLVLIVVAFSADFTPQETRMPFALGCAEWWLAITGWAIIYRNKSST